MELRRGVNVPMCIYLCGNEDGMEQCLSLLSLSSLSLSLSLALSLSLSLSRSLSLSLPLSLTLSHTPFGEPFRRSKAALSAQQLKSNDPCCAYDKHTHIGCVHAHVNTSIIDSMSYGATSTEDALYAACSVLTLQV